VKCQICENPATVHLTDVVNQKKRELHLCERCARERNLLPAPPGPQLDLKALLNLLMHPFPTDRDEPGTTPSPAPGACAACGLTPAEFKAEGRLGCEHDYDALRDALEPLLERIHRARVHAGKAPRAVRVGEWKKHLRAAVAAEDYEEAARLRDLIRTAER
jgi:protein arginine kinase activator